MRSQKETGQNLIEVMLALALFLILIGGSAILAFRYLKTFQAVHDLTEVQSVVKESFEAVQGVVYQNWSSLQDGNYGLSSASGQWQLQSSPDTIDNKYIRTVTVSSVVRDASCQIIAAGGTADPDTKLVTVNISWPDEGLTQNKSFQQYFTSWNNPTTCLAVEDEFGGDTGGSGLAGDWTHPITLGTIDMGAGNSATSLDVMNKIVYMGSIASDAKKTDFFIIDATDGQQPTIASSLNTGAGLNAVDAAGQYVYAANKSVSAQLQIINVNDIQNPALIKSYQLVGVSGSGAVGNSIFYAASKVYIGTLKATGPEFFVIDVSDPNNPVKLGSKETDANVNAIYVDGETAYLATSDSEELKIFDVSDPANIVQSGGFDAPGESEDGKTLYLVASKMYLGRTIGGNHTNHQEFHILDISDPDEVQDLGSKDLATNLNGLVARDYLAFFATSNPNSELQIWNISDPGSIGAWASLNFPQEASGIDYEDNMLYISVRSNDSLRIVTSSP